MWDWIVNNISTIKDLLWIVFTLIATVVAILTYRRARYTLLQPLRTEVIKRQTDLLVDLLEFFNKDLLFSFKVDYIGLVALNMYMLLEDYGFILNKEIVETEIENERGGVLFLKEGQLSSVRKITNVFETNDSPKAWAEENKQISKQMYENAKAGKVEIEQLYLTKQHMMCINTLEQFAQSPFMPKKIANLLEEIQKDINYNLSVAMKHSLEKFVVDLCTQYKPTEESPVKIQSSALYNDFNQYCKQHQNEIEKIRNVIRLYLLIDKEWN